MEAVVGGDLVHHVFVFLLLEAVGAVGVEEVVGDAVAGICVEG